jgi:hypothetical protein
VQSASASAANFANGERIFPDWKWRLPSWLEGVLMEIIGERHGLREWIGRRLLRRCVAVGSLRNLLWQARSLWFHFVSLSGAGRLIKLQRRCSRQENARACTDKNGLRSTPRPCEFRIGVHVCKFLFLFFAHLLRAGWFTAPGTKQFTYSIRKNPTACSTRAVLLLSRV